MASHAARLGLHCQRDLANLRESLPVVDGWFHI